ncbi:hypothetical protein MMC26_006899 [Xylographa opegraphella]|nr:hypothetical protein [Xylographa opegraphella]
MCLLIIGEKHCDNCDELLDPYFVRCESVGSCPIFAIFKEFHGLDGKKVATELAEQKRLEAESQAAAVLCHHIEDGIPKMNPENTAVLNAAEWIVVDTNVSEEVVERARGLGLLDEGEGSESRGEGGGGSEWDG